MIVPEIIQNAAHPSHNGPVSNDSNYSATVVVGSSEAGRVTCHLNVTNSLRNLRLSRFKYVLRQSSTVYNTDVPLTFTTNLHLTSRNVPAEYKRDLLAVNVSQLLSSFIRSGR